MYWAKSISADELIDETAMGGGANVLAHGMARLNVDPNDLEAFVRPDDAAMFLGYRAMEAGQGFADSYVTWMATLRRRGDSADAIVECLQRVFTQMADEGSLVELLRAITNRARDLGYGKLWLGGNTFEEPLLATALKPVVEELGQPLQAVPTSGLVALVLSARA